MAYPPHGITAAVLASVTDLIDPDTPNIQSAIDAAVSYARNTAHWHIFPAVDDTLTVDGEGGEVLTLPSLHVNSITSVTERGRELEEWTDYEWSKTGDLKRLGGCWTTRWQGITVEMNHGYDLTSADFADLLKAIGTAVAMAAANPLGMPEVMGPFQWQSSAGAWIGDAATTLGRYALPWSA